MDVGGENGSPRGEAHAGRAAPRRRGVARARLRQDGADAVHQAGHHRVGGGGCAQAFTGSDDGVPIRRRVRADQADA